MVKSFVPPAGIRSATVFAVKVTDATANALLVHPAGAAVVFEKSVFAHGAAPHVPTTFRIRNLTLLIVSPAVLVFVMRKVTDEVVLMLKLAVGAGLVWVTV